MKTATYQIILNASVYTSTHADGSRRSRHESVEQVLEGVAAILADCPINTEEDGDQTDFLIQRTTTERPF